LEPFPGPSDERLSRAHGLGVHLHFAEESLNHDRFELWIDDELSHNWVAAQVPLGGRQQLTGFDLTEDKSQVEIAPFDEFDVVSADLTQVALVALSHECEPVRSRDGRDRWSEVAYDYSRLNGGEQGTRAVETCPVAQSTTRGLRDRRLVHEVRAEPTWGFSSPFGLLMAS